MPLHVLLMSSDTLRVPARTKELIEWQWFDYERPQSSHSSKCAVDGPIENASSAVKASVLAHASINSTFDAAVVALTTMSTSTDACPARAVVDVCDSKSCQQRDNKVRPAVKSG